MDGSIVLWQKMLRTEKREHRFHRIKRNLIQFNAAELLAASGPSASSVHSYKITEQILVRSRFHTLWWKMWATVNLRKLSGSLNHLPWYKASGWLSPSLLWYPLLFFFLFLAFCSSYWICKSTMSYWRRCLASSRSAVCLPEPLNSCIFNSILNICLDFSSNSHLILAKLSVCLPPVAIAKLKWWETLIFSHDPILSRLEQQPIRHGISRSI